MGCAPPLFNSGPHNPCPSQNNGALSTSCPGLIEGNPLPCPTLPGAPLIMPPHCAPGGVKWPWASDLQLRLAVPEPANPVEDTHPAVPWVPL